MYKNVICENANDSSETREIECKLVTVCPRCNISSPANILKAYYTRSDRYQDKAYCLYLCSACNTCYFVTYGIGGFNRASNIQLISPIPSEKINFQPEIITLSSSFVKIYEEANIAEKNGLGEICGIGYRKALEFLIKDYCLYLHPDNDDIKTIPLSQCISKYIDNERINTMAKASIWLGNDEAHYSRKHEDYSLSHLKSFINVCVAYIANELVYEQAAELLGV